MQVKDVMTPNPTCRTPETPLTEIAELMIKFDCGAIPIVKNERTKIPVGIVTDRDIVCRTLGKDLNPMNMNAGDVMSVPVVTASTDTSFEDCCRLMEEKQIRRVPVVDEYGACCGIVALADLAKYSTDEQVGEVMREVSTEIGAASNVT
jgi:FOG: CBS domain